MRDDNTVWFNPSNPLHSAWPFGHGVIITGHDVMQGMGVLTICAVPDTHIQGSGKTAEEALHAVAASDAPRTALTFKDAAAVRGLISTLLTLEAEMSDSTQEYQQNG